VNKTGIPTAVTLSPRRPTVVSYIQGVVKTPRGFGAVKAAKFGRDEVIFTSATGRKVAAPVHHEFLRNNGW
jgi:hypothetical protein